MGAVAGCASETGDPTTPLGLLLWLHLPYTAMRRRAERPVRCDQLISDKEITLTNEPISSRDVYSGWETYQQLLIRAISPLTPEQLNFRTAANLRSIGENCRHIIGARARWCHLDLKLGDDTLDALGQWDRRDLPERSATELVEGMRASWAVLWDALGAWTVSDLAEPVLNSDPAPGEPETFTRGWIMWHLIEHDLHHGGEISLILGSHGLVGLDI